jgi:hypothetical protein
MKNIAWIVALLWSFAILTPAQMTGQSSAEKSTAPAVESHVRKLWEAFKNKDKATLSSLLDGQFRMFEEGLSTFGDKKAEVNGPDEYELLDYTLSDFTVKPICPNSALVTYVAVYQGKSGGEIQKAKSVFGEVWTRTDDHWKVLYLQETYIK